MKKRLRKKLRVKEFTVREFFICVLFDEELDDEKIDDFVDKFLLKIESLEFSCFGITCGTNGKYTVHTYKHWKQKHASAYVTNIVDWILEQQYTCRVIHTEITNLSDEAIDDLYERPNGIIDN